MAFLCLAWITTPLLLSPVDGWWYLIWPWSEPWSWETQVFVMYPISIYSVSLCSLEHCKYWTKQVRCYVQYYSAYIFLDMSISSVITRIQFFSHQTTWTIGTIGGTFQSRSSFSIFFIFQGGKDGWTKSVYRFFNWNPAIHLFGVSSRATTWTFFSNWELQQLHYLWNTATHLKHAICLWWWWWWYGRNFTNCCVWDKRGCCVDMTYQSVKQL